MKQGLNVAEDIKLVKDGKTVYVSNRLGNLNVYSASLDGSNEKLLSDNQNDSDSPYFDTKSGYVYFLSKRESVQNMYGNIIPLVYRTPIDGGSIERVSVSNYDDFGSIGNYSFECMKRFYAVETFDYTISEYRSQIYYGNIDGSNMKLLSEEVGSVYAIVPANNGDFVLYTVTNSISESIYYINSQNLDKRKVYEVNNYDSLDLLGVSPNRKYALVRWYNANKIQQDLLIIGIFDNSRKELTNSTSDETNASFSSDGNSVSFISNRDGKKDLYTIGIDASGEEKISTEGNVSDFFYLNNLIFYINDKMLFVNDPLFPGISQQVSDDVYVAYYSYYF